MASSSSPSKPSSWGQWGNKIAAASRPRQPTISRTFGIDIVGFGPIGRELAIKLSKTPSRFAISSITDSSAVLYPKNAAQVVEVAKWKAEGKENKLVDFKCAQVGARGDLLQGIEFSKSSIVVDSTNSDYTKHEEAKKRAVTALNSGKHYVCANKVALAFHYGEIFELAKKRGLKVGYGATNLSARHAITVAQSMEKDELTAALALLNSATTVVLSNIESDPSMTMEQAIEIAGKDGILESDPSIDLDGWDAAAKAAIFSNAIFPERRVSINDVLRDGIRDEKAKQLIETQRKDGEKKYRIREVAEITREKVIVEPRLVEASSPLAIGGHSGVVTLHSKVSGDIVIKSTFSSSGIELTSSVLLSDINKIVSSIGAY
jgi:homoserine dehydrogenase